MLQGLYRTPLSIDVHMVSLGGGKHTGSLVLFGPLGGGDTQSYTIQSQPPLPISREPEAPPGVESGTLGHMPGCAPWGSAPSLASGRWMWGRGGASGSCSRDGETEQGKLGTPLGHSGGQGRQDLGSDTGSAGGFSCSLWQST